ncbi:acyltransferase [Corynebacterium aquatimens]|uniref:acyltransferase family protein n=1 Tax=Corynebacterium TaxID=1716 RepID=UPI001F16F4E2|nr:MULTISPECIES: acyltransferase [Corynebacterium]QYH19130.1 acyltransferase [Corynebacterium aquatimens]UIZ91999.1 acyltransferase [Corynebacterium sp. CNCTC7651]
MRVPYNGHIGNHNVLPELEGLRAVAALGILTTHVAFQTGTKSPLLERFDYFVAVFFALSAFLLARGGLREGYYERRLARLAPAYLVCVATVLAVLPPLTTVTRGQALANLLLVQIYVPDALIDGLTQLWSLCVEVAFYLVLPLYLRLGARGRWLTLLLAVPLGLLWPWLIDPITTPNLQIWPPSYAPWFAVGLVLAELERYDVHFSPPRWPFPLLGLGVAWFAGVIGPPGLTHPTPAEFNARVILGTVFAACFVAPYALAPRFGGGELGGMAAPQSTLAPLISPRTPVLQAPLASAPMRALGRWSYSIFLWHVAVLYFAFPVLGVPLFSGHFVPVWLFTVVVSVAVAYVSYELVELPGARFLRRLQRGRHGRHGRHAR